MPIKLLVGLGNPGPKYHNTRHNAGFWLVEAYADSVRAHFTFNKSFNARVARDGGLWMELPETFMNGSGFSVLAAANFYKILPDEILVVHDELDFLPGEVKLKKGGGHAGHNGLRDITAALGSGDFWRLRIGIGHPRSLNVKSDVAAFVLNAPRIEEQTAIDDAMQRALKVLPQFLQGDYEAAMMILHRKP